MPIYLKTSVATNSWRKATSLYLKTSAATNSWRKIVSAYVKTNDGWRSLFSSIVFPSIENQVSISSSGGINAGSTIMSDSSSITLTSTRYHWNDADGFTYIWQKSANNSTWTNIGTAQSTTNPASGASSSSITRTLSASDFTSGSDMYFRFVFSATNSTYSTSASSESLSVLISYYGTPVPQPGSPSITGSTVVGNTASANIGTWTNSPTSYDYRVYYTSGLSSYPLTYAGVQSVSNKFLSGFSAALVNSASHGYKVNDTVIVSGMDSLFNGSHTITAKTNNTIYITLPTPTGWSASTAYSIGDLVSYLGDAYYASIAMPAPSLFSIGNAYSVGSNAWDGFTRYRCIQSISAVSAWSSSGNYATGSVIHYNGTRWQAQQNSGPGYLIPGTSTPVGPQTPSSGNYLYWSEINVALSNTSYWQNAYPYNSSYWTLQSFSNTVASGTTTAPNYYEGTVSSSTSIPIPITTFSYKENIDLRGATTSGSGAVLNFGVKAYNQATLSPSEYFGTAFIYGVPILSIGSITPVYTTASVPFTSSYVSSYLLNLYTQPSITNVVGGASTVTYSAVNTFTSGQQVVISGINPSQYNGTRTIQSATSTSFIVSANITGAYVSGGTAKVTVSGYPLTVSSNTSPRSITGLSEGTTYYLEMTPANSGTTGTMQTSSFTTLVQPTISGISLTTTPLPSSATGITTSSSSNVGTTSWTNGSNTSFANLSLVTGAGTLAQQNDPTSLTTSGTFAITSSGNANITIRAINANKRVDATWTQTNAQSYSISYDVTGVPGNPQTVTGNSSASNPSAQLLASAGTVTLRSITVYPQQNQLGTGVTLTSTLSATAANTTTSTSATNAVTYSSPPATPTITYSNVTSGSFTVTWGSSGATSYNVSVYDSITAASLFSAVGTTATTVSPTGLQPNRSYSTTVTAFNSAGNASFTASTTTSLGAALTPTFGANSSTVGGFTGSVTNYDANYTFGISTSVGSVSFSSPSGSTRAFTVSGLSSAQSATVTVTTSRTGYSNGSAQTTGSAVTVQYSVSWNSNGGTAGTVTTGPFNAGTPHTAPSPGTRAGFAFSNWRYPVSGDLISTLQPGQTYTPTQSGTTFGAIWNVVTPTPTVSTIRASTTGRSGTSPNFVFANPKATFSFTFTDTVSCTIHLDNSLDGINWTLGTANNLSVSGNAISLSTNLPSGTTSASGNYYYRARVNAWSGATQTGNQTGLKTSSSVRNTTTPVNNASLSFA
jgi:hypothetical protein